MPDNEPQAQPQPTIQVNAQYIKDLSFEAPGTPAIFADLQSTAPDITVQVNLNATTLHETLYEVVLKIRIEAKLKDKVAFLAELAYGGVFTLQIPAEHMQPVLLIECPRLLFPFARNILADAIRDGGFPPFLLPPFDFTQLYLQRQQQAANPPPAGNA